MKQEDTGKIQGVENGMEGTEKDKFERKYDANQGRVSYGRGFSAHCHEELFFIAGVLDLLFLVDIQDQWNNRGEEISFVIMDARDRAKALCSIF